MKDAWSAGSSHVTSHLLLSASVSIVQEEPSLLSICWLTFPSTGTLADISPYYFLKRRIRYQVQNSIHFFPQGLFLVFALTSLGIIPQKLKWWKMILVGIWFAHYNVHCKKIQVFTLNPGIKSQFSGLGGYYIAF